MEVKGGKEYIIGDSALYQFRQRPPAPVPVLARSSSRDSIGVKQAGRGSGPSIASGFSFAGEPDGGESLDGSGTL